ncbi:hypothetical protein scyTo_0022550, partial [Scyliorhinus torazame]|nr:hypothetical protein [Scyliorhinus torazame]
MKGDTILSGDSIYQISIDNKTLRIDAPQLPNCELITCVVRNKVSENRNSRLLRISGLLSLHEFSLVSSAIALVSSVTSYGAEAFIILYALDAYKIHKRHVELTAVFVFFQMISCLTLLTASVFCVIDPSYPLAYRIISGAAILFITAKIIYVLALYLQHESELKRSFLVKQRRRNIFLLCGTFRIIISIIPIYRGLYN